LKIGYANSFSNHAPINLLFCFSLVAQRRHHQKWSLENETKEIWLDDVVAARLCCGEECDPAVALRYTAGYAS
jgi:hypothetical protein